MKGLIKPSKNSKLLVDFVNFCIKNPGLRFWQALSLWSEGKILHCDDDETYDTFYWEKRSK